MRGNIATPTSDRRAIETEGQLVARLASSTSKTLWNEAQGCESFALPWDNHSVNCYLEEVAAKPHLPGLKIIGEDLPQPLRGWRFQNNTPRVGPKTGQPQGYAAKPLRGIRKREVCKGLTLSLNHTVRKSSTMSRYFFSDPCACLR